MSGAFDNKGTRIRNLNIANDHLGGLLNSFWNDNFALVEILGFSKCDMCLAPYLP